MSRASSWTSTQPSRPRRRGSTSKSGHLDATGRRELVGEPSTGPPRSEGSPRPHPPEDDPVGITGPIGCGKSTVAALVGEQGVVVIDADRIAHEVTGPDEPATAAIFERFGDDVRAADGALDLAALGRIVFGDLAALRDLEAIVHPAVRPRIVAAVRAAEESRRGRRHRGHPARRGRLRGRVRRGLACRLRRSDQRSRLRDRGLPDEVVEQRIAALWWPGSTAA